MAQQGRWSQLEGAESSAFGTVEEIFTFPFQTTDVLGLS